MQQHLTQKTNHGTCVKSGILEAFFFFYKLRFHEDGRESLSERSLIPTVQDFALRKYITHVCKPRGSPCMNPFPFPFPFPFALFGIAARTWHGMHATERSDLAG